MQYKLKELSRETRQGFFHTDEKDTKLYPLNINGNYNPMISSSANLDSYLYATKMELCYINLHKKQRQN